VAEDTIAAVPAGVSDEQAAIAACAIGTVLNAVRDVARVKLGARVLGTGAGGGLGVHAVQMARLAGAHVIAQTTTADKAALLAEIGANDVLVTARAEDFSARVRALTGGEGVDVVIDNVGTPLFTAMRRSLAVNGRWVLVGQLTGEFVPFNPAQLFLRNQSMLSVNSTTRAQLEDTLALIARGDIRPVISGMESLDNVGAVHERMERGSVAGRIVVRPGGAPA
jgi:NADPH:quinone reductase-like Zn-dependent oxidoreductase